MSVLYEVRDRVAWVTINRLEARNALSRAVRVDLVVAADNAGFTITEAKVGRGSPWAAALPWLIPPRPAMELLLTGEPISAQRAYELGLVNRVVPGVDLAAPTQELATTIADNAPLSVRAAEALVYASAEMGCSAALDVGDRSYEGVYLSEDGQEGPAAFRDKRRPV